LSNNDQRFMDVFSLVIGLLVATAVGLVVLALIIGSRTQTASLRDNPTFTTETNERLQPFGRVVLTGEAVAAEATTAAAPAPVNAPLSGPQVFNQACNACHGGGIGGAPKSGDKAAWAARIAQGNSTLYKHALEGFQGAAGFMPPKGGWVNLSDAEITAAVDYMVGQSR
jgi:cytochrome c5